MRRLLPIALLALLSCRTMPAARETGFLDRTLTLEGRFWPYVVYVPRDYGPARRWPVILFLHGVGERGTDGLRATQIGVGAAIRSAPERIPAIVVFPQAPPETRWLDGPARAAMLALDATLAELRTDPDRVYLTGLSMGGYGAWHLGLAHRERFAALWVVCGGLLPRSARKSVARSPLLDQAADPYAFTAEALATMPIRIVHGAEDPVIPVEESRRMAEALRRAGARDARYLELAGVGHDAWGSAYGDEEGWRWLFAQRR